MKTKQAIAVLLVFGGVLTVVTVYIAAIYTILHFIIKYW